MRRRPDDKSSGDSVETRSKNFRRESGKLTRVKVEKRVFRSRALVRVVRVEKQRVKLCLPGWNSRSFFWVPKSVFPAHFKFERGYRFHANVNLAAARPADLDFRPPFETGSTEVPSWADLMKSGVVVVELAPNLKVS